MTDRSAVDAIKRALSDPLHVAELLGLEPRRDGHSVKIRCVWHAERSGSLDLAVREGVLLAHCHACGNGGDVLALVAAVRGIDIRADFPRVLRETAALAGEAPISPATPRPMPRPERTPPPPDEVVALWSASTSAYDDGATAGYLRGRAIDPAHVVDRDLARVLPTVGVLPRWARYGGRPWTETGHRLIVPMFDASGRMVTLRAWRIVDGDTPKRLPPAGHTIPRSVMADPLGRLILGNANLDWWSMPRTLIIAEGEPDFLTWATHYGDDERAPSVWGTISGCWSGELAARIPSATTVILRHHLDAAGERYVSQIQDSLIDRCELRKRVAHEDR